MMLFQATAGDPLPLLGAILAVAALILGPHHAQQGEPGVSRSR